MIVRNSKLDAWMVFALLAFTTLAVGNAAAESTPDRRDTVVPYVQAPSSWDRFLILVWQYKTDALRDLELYQQAGFGGFHIDYGAGQEERVDFAIRHQLPYYVDHAAGKGILHLTNRTGLGELPDDGSLAPRPQSLADVATWDRLVEQLRANLTVTRRGPVVAAAFDDEVSLGSFTSPQEVDASPQSIAMYRHWLRDQYGVIRHLNQTWRSEYTAFSEVRPVPFGDVRTRNDRPPFARWNLAPWMDWRTFMDWQFADVCARLTRVANDLAPQVPAGFVGGQQPAPYGGYDYDRLRDCLQWIEAYDIGGTNEILRSFWCFPQAKPRVQTFFSTGDARQDAWFLWYYLLHGNRAVIAWPEREGKSWFQDGRLASFVAENRETCREVQGDISRAILADDARFDADPIAILYSHASIQASWATDVVTHGKTWPRRSSSLDNNCQTAGKNRVAWFKLLEDCGYQYDVVSDRELLRGVLENRRIRVLILNRAIALSDAHCQAIESFVRAGGTVIADYWTGLLDEHGVGRSQGGGLDALFGIRRDESRGYFDGTTITEIDGERYARPFLDRFPSENLLRYDGRMIVERGTIADTARATQRVAGADVVLRRRVGRGNAIYLNLSPVEYFDNGVRLQGLGQQGLGQQGLGQQGLGQQWRDLLSGLLEEARLEPRAATYSDGRRVPMAEMIFWRTGDRQILAVVKNPSRQASTDAATAAGQVLGAPMAVEIRLSRDYSQIRDLRSGTTLPAGRIIRAPWNPWEGLVFELK